jgi:hypothetical protein
MDTDNSTLVHPLLSVFLAVVVLFLFGIPVAHGQVHEGGGIGSSGSQDGVTHSSQLPDWAQPANDTSPSTGENRDAPVTNDQMRTKQPDLPDDPEQVPVDGGLALLAAAGAGYAVRRLNNEEKDEFEE